MLGSPGYFASRKASPVVASFLCPPTFSAFETPGSRMPRVPLSQAEPFQQHNLVYCQTQQQQQQARSYAGVPSLTFSQREPVRLIKYFEPVKYGAAEVSFHQSFFGSKYGVLPPYGRCSATFTSRHGIYAFSNRLISHGVFVFSSSSTNAAVCVLSSSNAAASTVIEGRRSLRRLKKNSEEALTNLKLNMCSKNGDLHGALKLLEEVKREGKVNLQLPQYNILLYICSGAASGSLTRGRGWNRRNLKESSGSENPSEESSSCSTLDDSEADPDQASNPDVIQFSREDMELAAKKGIEIYEDMVMAKIPPNEATFTAIARLAAAKGDGDLAFEIVKIMAAQKIAPKLRSYGPPLLCFCENKQVEKAFDVDSHMLSYGVSPDEPLLEALLNLSIEAELDDKVYALLHRIRMTVREGSVSVIGSVERWFKSEAAASAGEALWDSLPSKEELKKATDAGGGGWHGLGWLGMGTWNVSRTNISKQGRCMSCGERLCTIDLDPEETENFAESIAVLACQREQRPNEFRAFQKWLKQHGPFEAIIDGANVGLYNPQAHMVFNFFQLNAVSRAIVTKTKKRRILIVLHRRRTSNAGVVSPKAQPMVKRWMDENMLYSTPHGSNDDWYWLYAAVSCKCLLVTNDEMRDHLFELLGNDFFPKWKERHQVRFTFKTNSLELHMPPPYSIVIQESENGSWHLPQMGGDDIETPREWLCVTRPGNVNEVPKIHNAHVNVTSSNGKTESNITAPPRHFSSAGQTLNPSTSACLRVNETFLKLKEAERHTHVPIDFQI